MATGYTCDIKEGQSFDDFVMGCARAFGACVGMRDDPQSAEIPDKFEPSPYHARQLETETKKLAELKSMTSEDAIKKAKALYKDECDSRTKSLADNTDLIEKYRAMIKKVTAWVPPSKDHKEMKNFMIDQLKKSLKHDDMSDYYENNPPTQLTGDAWLGGQISITQDSVDYHIEEQAKENERCNGRTEWVQQLRDSLK